MCDARRAPRAGPGVGPHTDRAAAVAVAERIRTEVAAAVSFEEHPRQSEKVPFAELTPSSRRVSRTRTAGERHDL